MGITRKKTTVYLDPQLLHAVKVLAASSGRHDYEIIEEALRQFLHTSQAETSRQALRELLNDLAVGQAALNDEEALKLAYGELHEARGERHQD